MSYKMIVGEKLFPSLQHAAYVAKHMKFDPDYADCETKIIKMGNGSVKVQLIRTVKGDDHERHSED